MAALTALAIGAGLLGGAILSGAGKKTPKTPAVPELPTAPDPLAPVNAMSAALTRMRLSQTSSPANHSGTLLTGPSGLASPAPTVRKTLLGT